MAPQQLRLNTHEEKENIRSVQMVPEMVFSFFSEARATGGSVIHLLQV